MANPFDQFDEQSQSYGNRPDGSRKGRGFLGEIPIPGTTDVATEYSVGVNIDGKDVDIPTLIPTLSKEEVAAVIEAARNNQFPPEDIIAKAADFARSRIADGKPLYATEEESSNPFDAFDIQDNQQSLPEESTLQQINREGGEFLADQPAVTFATELASAINRGAINIADFFTTKPVNGLLAAAGIDASLPSLNELPGIKQATQGGFMEEGMARDITQKAGEYVAPGVATGQAIRSATSIAPTVASGAQTVGSNILKSMGAGNMADDAVLAGKAGFGGGIGQEVGGDTGEMIGALLAPASGAATKAVARQIAKTGKLIPKEMPEKLLESAMKFRPSIKPEQRANMTRTALREGVMPTVKGLEKIATRLDSLDTGLNKIIDDATRRGVTIPKGVIFKELKQVRGKMGGAKINAQSDLKAIDSVAKQFNQNLSKMNKSRLTPRELQDLKTDAYKRINFDLTQGKASFAKNEAMKSMARQAKESLEGLDPDIKGLNRQMGDLLELNKELERVVSRLDNRNLISLDTAVKIGAGASTGTTTGTVAGTAASILGAPRVKAKTAMILENLRVNANTIKSLEKLDPEISKSLLFEALKVKENLESQLEDE